jgi:hypothetical protein
MFSNGGGAHPELQTRLWEEARGIVVLYNPISGAEHLDASARLYAQVLVELGHRVVLVAQTDSGAAGTIAAAVHDAGDRFAFVSFDTCDAPRPVAAPPKERRPSIAERVRYRFGMIVRRVARRIAPLVSRVAPPGAAASGPVDPGRIPFALACGRIERALEIVGRREPILTFFLYLDIMSDQVLNLDVMNRRETLPWSGILFHPAAKVPGARVENAFASPAFRGAVFLVPAAMGPYAAALPDRRFVLAPDIADLRLPERPPSLALEIGRRAGERTVVLLIGTIGPHKGAMRLVRTVAKADPERYFFALVGRVHWSHFGEDEEALRAFYDDPPENVLVSDDYIADEPDYNAVVMAASIVFAAYSGFDSSSNSLAKAAGFRRPILVTTGTLMAQRVEEFDIGAVVDPEEPDAILDALGTLRSRTPESFGFEAFDRAHCIDALRGALSRGLEGWFDTGSPAAKRKRS